MLYWLLGALGLTGGGIGIAALLGGGPAMLLGVKWLISWLSHATFLQVVCIALGAAFAVDHIALIMAHRHTVKVEAQLSASAAQLTTARANGAGLEKAIADQNSAIAALSAKSAQQQQAAAKASQIAQERSDKAQATSTRLTASSHAGGAPCEPSAALKGAWQ